VCGQQLVWIFHLLEAKRICEKFFLDFKSFFLPRCVSLKRLMSLLNWLWHSQLQCSFSFRTWKKLIRLVKKHWVFIFVPMLPHAVCVLGVYCTALCFQSTCIDLSQPTQLFSKCNVVYYVNSRIKRYLWLDCIF